MPEPRPIDPEMPDPAPGWAVSGPWFKDADAYLNADRTNHRVARPGYGWPLGTECWWFDLHGRGLLLQATGPTIHDAVRRAEALMWFPDDWCGGLAEYAGVVRSNWHPWHAAHATLPYDPLDV